MLTVHYGNGLEGLAARLAAVLREDPLPPLEAEWVVTSGNGMGRWLSLFLACELGVCSQVRFPLPGGFVWQVWRAALPELPETSAFSAPVLLWRIDALLGEGEPPADFAAYLRGGDGPRRFDLARELAELYDRYLIYRPDWIGAWEAGEGDDGVAQLWRRLAGQGGEHRARLWDRVRERLAQPLPLEGLPRRVMVFGLSSLAPLYWETLRLAAAHVDVQVFILNPCREYWGDIRSPKALAREERAGRGLHGEVGNPLLASWGRLGRDFLDMVLEADPVIEEAFAEPGEGSLLACLQSDILHLQDRSGEGGAKPADPMDCSVQVHVCHGPLRELEVLHDRLLALFEAEPGLTPDQVLVMTPDLPRYAPYIEAVFGPAPSERWIPYQVADAPLGEDAWVSAFLALLDLAGGRFAVTEVLALLDREPVRARFGLDGLDLETVRAWLREAGIRWGRDLAPEGAHSWRAGLDRLILGYALPGAGRRLFDGILPYDGVEGADGARTLGALATFAETVFDFDRWTAQDRPPAEWAQSLGEWAGRFLDDTAGALGPLRGQLGRMAEEAEAAGARMAVPFAVVRDHLRRVLGGAEGGRPFLAGGVTFAAMVPMRSVPAEVVCLIGLDDGVYPRQQRPAAFDRMAREPRRGDRSRREDDRYLFLEALLSARKVFYLSYVGRDIRDNAVMPPSVLVSELLDYVTGAYGASIVTEHPLQAFSRRYFDGSPGLFSYDAELASARRAGGRETPRPFAAEPLSAGATGGEVDFARLREFWRAPARFFCRWTLGLHLEEGEALLADREPFTLDGLERWQLGQQVLDLVRHGVEAEEALDILRNGTLPPALPGDLRYWRERREALRFSEHLDTLQKGVPGPSEFDLDIGPWRLCGSLDGLGPEGRLAYRYGKERPSDLLDLWLNHLVLQLVAGGHWSRLLSQDGLRELPPVPEPEARAQLGILLDLHGSGQGEPLPFFPKASRACARAFPSKGEGGAQAAALRAWAPDGEGDDPYVRLAFRDQEPLGARFRELALAVFGPLLAALGEG